jgi:hypothetical protein
MLYTFFVLFHNENGIMEAINDSNIKTDRTPWSSDKQSCFVFGSSWVKISARKPTTMNDTFCGFIQLLQVNYEIEP